MVVPFSKVCSKIWIEFCVLTPGNAFPQKFYFKTNRKNIESYKSGTRGFQNSPLFERLPSFYLTISGNIERFQYFNFEIGFVENVNLIKKLEYGFLVKSTKIENTLFRYETSNVKTNRMVSTNWTYHKEQSFASNYFIFLKIQFQINNL